MYIQVPLQEGSTRTFDKLGMFWLADRLPAQICQEISQIPRRVCPAIAIQVDHGQAILLKEELVRAHRPMTRDSLWFLELTDFGVEVLKDFFIFGCQIRPNFVYNHGIFLKIAQVVVHSFCFAGSGGIIMKDT